MFANIKNRITGFACIACLNCCIAIYKSLLADVLFWIGLLTCCIILYIVKPASLWYAYVWCLLYIDSCSTHDYCDYIIQVHRITKYLIIQRVRTLPNATGPNWLCVKYFSVMVQIESLKCRYGNITYHIASCSNIFIFKLNWRKSCINFIKLWVACLWAKRENFF